jgi:plasmid stabilization system protein ParE
MKVVVSERAKRNRNQIAGYILRTFGEKTLLEFRDAYKKTKEYIAKYPTGCEVEENLSDKERTYRFTSINGLTKLVYRIDEDKEVVYIVDMWDVRKEPPISVE